MKHRTRTGALLLLSFLMTLLLPTVAAHADYTTYQTAPTVAACWNKVDAYGGVYQVSNYVVNTTGTTKAIRVDVWRPNVGFVSSNTYAALDRQKSVGPVANLSIPLGDTIYVYVNGTRSLGIPASGIPYYMQNCQAQVARTAKLQAAISYGMSQLGAIYVGCAAGTYREGAVPTVNLSHDGRTCGQTKVYFQPAGVVGFDCSGLVKKMMNQAGIAFSYGSTAAMDSLPKIDKSQLRAGDLLLKPGSHVVVYLGDGDGDGIPSVLEATPKTQRPDGAWTGVVISDARTYLNDAAYTARTVPGA
jgi:hypothetical protein